MSKCKQELTVLFSNEPGVYVIRNRINDQVYIGSAVTLARRMYKHLLELKKGIHHSSKLQRFVDKYGIEQLYFQAQRVKKEDLLKTEQFLLDRYHPFYNTLVKAKSRLGLKNSERSKELVRAWKKNHKLTEEHKLNLSKSHQTRTVYRATPVIQLTLKGDFIKEWPSISVAERLLNNSGISNCVNGRSKFAAGHLWVYKSEYQLKQAA